MVVKGSLVEISVGVGGFPVDAVAEFAVWFSGDEDIKESDLAGLLLLHGELDSGVLLVEILQKLEERVQSVGPNDKGVIHVAEPQAGSEISGE